MSFNSIIYLFIFFYVEHINKYQEILTILLLENFLVNYFKKILNELLS